MSFIQNFFTSRDNQTAEVDNQTGNIGNTFVGQLNRLWYNPETNSIYVSDGSTPGGILVAGPGGGNPFNQNLNTYNDVTFANITATGNVSFSNTATIDLGNLSITDQTISGEITNRDISISPSGTGTLRTLNGIGVYQGSYTGTPLFSVSTTGVVSTLMPNAESYLGAMEIVGNPTGTTVAPQNYGTMLHVTGVPTVAARIYNDGVANYAAIINRRYNGTSDAPTPVLNNQIISRLGGTPYLDNGSTGEWPERSTTRFDFIATEDQTTAAQGSKMQFYTVANGENDPTLTMELDIDTGIKMYGDILPSVNNTFSLGNSTQKWADLWIGPQSIFLEDSVLGGDSEMHVDNGVYYIEGVTAQQVGNMQMTTNGLRLTTASTGENIQIGENTDTGYVEVNMVGIEFKDGTRQTTAAIPLAQRGNAGGVATLGLDGIVPSSQLPGGGPVYKGTWNATTNTPTLADGTGSGGDEYAVIVAGTQNLGSGAITFAVGDFVIYNGSIWQKIPGVGSGVTSFNTRTGAVTLSSGDVTNALSNGSITNNFLNSDNWRLLTGQGIGLTGNATVELGDQITLTNTGVTAAIGGTGVGVSAATGNVTFSIGQPVGTANSVSFAGITSTTTIAATGNLAAGNIATGGRVVATGNIVTGGYVLTPGTSINSGIVTTGNITGGNLSITSAGTFGTTLSVTGNITGGNLTVVGQTNLGNVGNVHITGGNIGDRLRTDGAGGLSWVAPLGNVNTYVGANTTVNIDFTYDSIVLVYLPTGPVNINLANYSAGHQSRVIVRFGPTPYTINTGVGNVAQSTEGLITIPTSGSGGHNLDGNSSCQLVYTCFDNTAGNCYVAATFL